MSVFSTGGGGMSKREGQRFSKEVRKGLEDSARAAYRKKLAELDAELERTKTAGRERVKTQRTTCAAEVQDTRQAARADAKKHTDRCREAARAEMRNTVKSCRIEAQSEAKGRVDEKRGACRTENQQLREAVRTEAQIIADRKKAERDFRAEMSRIEAGNKARDRDRSTAKKGESVKEKIDALENEIERSAPQLMPYWRKVRNKAAFVQETGRRSAFERLVEMAEEDSEAGQAAEDDAEAYVRQLQREQGGGQRTRSRRRVAGDKIPF